MKNGVCTLFGLAGAFVAELFGGFDASLQALLVFMAADYVTGLVVAGVFKRSGKTENGRLDSREGFKGLCRKGVALLLVLVASRLDMVIGTAYIRDAVCIAFMANELISLVENAGMMGVSMPDVIVKAIDVLQRDERKESEGDD